MKQEKYNGVLNNLCDGLKKLSDIEIFNHFILHMKNVLEIGIKTKLMSNTCQRKPQNDADNNDNALPRPFHAPFNKKGRVTFLLKRAVEVGLQY